MMKLLSTILFLAIFSSVQAQSQIQKMYEQKRYKEIVAMAESTDKLNGQDVFVIGQSYLMLKDSRNALAMFNISIKKGYRDGELYYAKGLAEANMELFRDAATSFRTALFYMPNRKKVMIELASAYYGGNQLDSALAVNQRIESYWGDYYPAVYMGCRLLYEQEKPAKALECYYEKLYMLKKDEVLYRKALNDVIRIEWHEFKNYPKTEKAIKNLMESAPNNYDYNMLLMQFYNFTGKYDLARVQENYIMEGYKNGKLSNAHYDKGTMVMEQFDTAIYQIEVFRYFQPQKKGDCTYVAFIFNLDTSRPLGKTTACTKDEQFILSGYRAEVPLVFEMEVNYENFKKRCISLLFSAETDEVMPEER